MGTLLFLQLKSKIISKQEVVVVAAAAVLLLLIKRTAVIEVGSSRQLLGGWTVIAGVSAGAHVTASVYLIPSIRLRHSSITQGTLISAIFCFLKKIS